MDTQSSNTPWHAPYHQGDHVLLRLPTGFKSLAYMIDIVDDQLRLEVDRRVYTVDASQAADVEPGWHISDRYHNSHFDIIGTTHSALRSDGVVEAIHDHVQEAQECRSPRQEALRILISVVCFSVKDDFKNPQGALGL
jgi:hypothetical protein